MRARKRKDRFDKQHLSPQEIKPKKVKVIPLRYCDACGEGRVVDTHHIDKDRGNNGKNNIVDLCPTCHAVLHRQGLTINELLYKCQANPVKPIDTGYHDMSNPTYAKAQEGTRFVLDADGQPIPEY